VTVHDEALATRVRSALAMDKRISGLPIDVRVSGYDVFLKGTVENIEQADVLQFIATGIPGVRHVNLEEIAVKEKGI